MNVSSREDNSFAQLRKKGIGDLAGSSSDTDSERFVLHIVWCNSYIHSFLIFIISDLGEESFDFCVFYLRLKLFHRCCNAWVAELGEGEVFYDFVVEIREAMNWETAYQVLWDVVVTFTHHSHWYDSCWATVPISKMIDNCVSCWKDWASSSCLQNLSSSFLNSGNELLFQPLFISKFTDRFVLDSDVVDTRILGCWMISKDAQTFNLASVTSCFESNLSKSSVMI